MSKLNKLANIGLVTLVATTGVVSHIKAQEETALLVEEITSNYNANNFNNGEKPAWNIYLKESLLDPTVNEQDMFILTYVDQAGGNVLLRKDVDYTIQKVGVEERNSEQYAKYIIKYESNEYDMYLKEGSNLILQVQPNGNVYTKELKQEGTNIIYDLKAPNIIESSLVINDGVPPKTPNVYPKDSKFNIKVKDMELNTNGVDTVTLSNEAKQNGWVVEGVEKTNVKDGDLTEYIVTISRNKNTPVNASGVDVVTFTVKDTFGRVSQKAVHIPLDAKEPTITSELDNENVENSRVKDMSIGAFIIGKVTNVENVGDISFDITPTAHPNLTFKTDVREVVVGGVKEFIYSVNVKGRGLITPDMNLFTINAVSSGGNKTSKVVNGISVLFDGLAPIIIPERQIANGVFTKDGVIYANPSTVYGLNFYVLDNHTLDKDTIKGKLSQEDMNKVTFESIGNNITEQELLNKAETSNKDHFSTVRNLFESNINIIKAYMEDNPNTRYSLLKGRYAFRDLPRNVEIADKNLTLVDNSNKDLLFNNIFGGKLYLDDVAPIINDGVIVNSQGVEMTSGYENQQEFNLQYTITDAIGIRKDSIKVYDIRTNQEIIDNSIELVLGDTNEETPKEIKATIKFKGVEGQETQYDLSNYKIVANDIVNNRREKLNTNKVIFVDKKAVVVESSKVKTKGVVIDNVRYVPTNFEREFILDKTSDVSSDEKQLQELTIINPDETKFEITKVYDNVLGKNKVTVRTKNGVSGEFTGTFIVKDAAGNTSQFTLDNGESQTVVVELENPVVTPNYPKQQELEETIYYKDIVELDGSARSISGIDKVELFEVDMSNGELIALPNNDEIQLVVNGNARDIARTFKVVFSGENTNYITKKLHVKVTSVSGREEVIPLFNDNKGVIIDKVAPVIDFEYITQFKDGVFETKDMVEAKVIVKDKNFDVLSFKLASNTWKVKEGATWNEVESGVHELVIVNDKKGVEENASVMLEAQDYVGFKTTLTSGKVLVDRLAPRFTISAPTKMYSKENPKVNVGFKDFTVVKTEILKRSGNKENFTIDTKQEVIDGLHQGTSVIDIDAEGTFSSGYWTIRLTDKLGNIAELPLDMNITIDKTAPKVEVTNKNQGTYINKDAEVEVLVNEKHPDFSKMQIIGDYKQQGTWENVGADMWKATFRSVGVGEKPFEVVILDKAGNSTRNNLKERVVVDTTKPTIQVVEDYENGKISNKTHSVDVIVKDSVGISKDKIKISGADKLEVVKETLTEVIYKATLEKEGVRKIVVNAMDFAGNIADTVNSKEIDIDKTAPKLASIQVTNKKSNSYYNGNVVYTVTVEDKHFENQPLITFKGANVTQWEKVGEGLYRTTLTFSANGVYEGKINVVDRAGNISNEISIPKFTIDKEAPTIAINDIANSQVFYKDVSGSVELRDTNIDMESSTLSLKNITTGETINVGRNGTTYVIPNIEKDKKFDGVYELVVTARDLAGNETKDTRTFVLNRFGSTFSLENKDLVKQGIILQKLDQDMVILETTYTKPVAFKVFANRDGKDIDLTEKVKQELITDGLVKKYRYTISKDDFVDGYYIMQFSTIDDQSVESTLESELRFTIDSKAPVVTTNITEKFYAEKEKVVYIDVEDLTGVNEIKVVLDDGTEILPTYNEATKQYSFTLKESNKEQKFKIVVKDNANWQTEVEQSVRISSDFFVGLWYSIYTWIALGIVGFLSLVGMLFFLFGKKKKEKEEDQQDSTTTGIDATQQ